MKNLVLSILCAFSFVFSAMAQDAKQIAATQNTEAILRVENEGKTIELRKNDLVKLPRLDVRANTHDGMETNFSGVDLREILKLAGAKFGEEGKKTNLISYLIIEAADKYRAIFAMIELEPDFTDKVVILADTRDGKSLSKEAGNWQISAPDEKKQARWVRQVVALKITTVK